MFRTLGIAFAALVLAAPAAAQVTPFPADFRTREIATNGATIHVRVGGHGPPVGLLHGHFRVGGGALEGLGAGRERIYLARFGNDFAADPRRVTEATRAHYAALYALPGAMHSGFAQFAAFDQDAADNKAILAARG